VRAEVPKPIKEILAAGCVVYLRAVHGATITGLSALSSRLNYQDWSGSNKSVTVILFGMFPQPGMGFVLEFLRCDELGEKDEEESLVVVWEYQRLQDE
jgi:hypothetical protein